MTNYYPTKDIHGTIRWNKTGFAVGDLVESTWNYSTQGMERGTQHEIASITYDDTYESDYVDHPDNNQYMRIYTQKISFRGRSSRFSANNFKKVVPMPPMLESNRPVIVREIFETLDEDNKIVTTLGPVVDLASMSEARLYTTDQITKSIRENNLYRSFRIYKEDSVARAKKPEIEFA